MFRWRRNVHLLLQTRNCWQIAHNRMPSCDHLVPRNVKWSNRQKRKVDDLFPVVNIKEAFRRCRDRALPVEDGYVLNPTVQRNEFEIAQARAFATGTVRVLLEAIEAATPPRTVDGKKVSILHRPVDPAKLEAELDKIWKPLNQELTDFAVLGVMKAVRNCVAGMHFFQWAKSQSGFEPSTKTYNGLIEMLAKRDYMDQALQMYKIMQRPSFVRQGCGLDGETVGILVHQLCEKELEKGLSVLNHALFEIQIDVPDTVIHDVIVCLCRLPGKLPLSLRYFHRMKSPMDETYQLLVRTMSKEQFVYEAYDLIVSMEVGKGFPTDDVTYHLLISEFCRRKELSRAHVLLYDFMERGRVPSVITFNTVLELLCSKGGGDFAEKTWRLFQSMKSRNVTPNAVTYSIVLQALSNGNRVDRAMILFDEMLRSGCTPGKATGSAVISALARADRVDEAMDLVMRMYKDFHSRVEFEAATNTIYGYLRLKPLNKSISALKKLHTVNFIPDLTLYNVVIAMLCKKKMFKQAMNYFNEAIFRSKADVLSYEPLILAFCKANKLPVAYKLFQDMIHRAHEPNLKIYRAIITSFTKAGKMDDACKLVEYMFNKDVYPDTELYNVVIEGLDRTGNTQARDVLRNAVNQCSSSPNEAMFNAIYKLRSCIRPVSRNGTDKNVQANTEAADVVEALPVDVSTNSSRINTNAPVETPVKVPQFSDSETDTESETESEEESSTVGEEKAMNRQALIHKKHQV